MLNLASPLKLNVQLVDAQSNFFIDRLILLALPKANTSTKIKPHRIRTIMDNHTTKSFTQIVT